MSASRPGDVFVLIMAGGAGTRFWPLSTEERPKQFLSLVGEGTLLQQSYARARALTEPENVLVLTAARFRDEVAREIPELAPGNIIGEPMRRDTAAPVALAALLAEARTADGVAGEKRASQNPVIIVLTADHRIEPTAAFAKDVEAAVEGAREGNALYTLGVSPTYAATGYGYLERGSPVRAPGGVKHYRLEQFREKPDEPTARRYLDSGRFYWNSGMFVWSVATILAEYARQLPGHLESLRPAIRSGGELDPQALSDGFAELPSVSIDFGIMEGAEEIRMIEASFEWDDIGSWPSLAEFLPEDREGNRYRGRLRALEARGNVVFAEDTEELIALLGVEGLIVVRSGNRTLIADRSRAEEIKRLTQDLGETSGKG